MDPSDPSAPEETAGRCRISPRFLRAARVEAVAQHVTLRLVDSRVIARTAPQRRTAARAFLEIGRADGLMGFNLVDTHAHGLVACSRARAGQFARRIELALRSRLGLSCPFEPARIRPVLDQWHLHRSIHYILQQQERHGVTSDPAHDASSLPDALGWRVADLTLAQTLRVLAPRVAITPPVDREALASMEVSPELLVEAAAAALALPDLRGQSAACVAARRAAARVAVVEHFEAKAIAEALSITRRRLGQLLAEPPPSTELLRATRIQLRFRAWLAHGRVSIGT